MIYEPNSPTWTKPTAEQLADGAVVGEVTTIGAAELAYYKGGVGEPDRSFHNLAFGTYYPLKTPIDFSAVIREATSDNSTFHGNIRIEDTRFDFSDTYKNQAGTETKHSITVQLSTGRFSERYDVNGGRTLEDMPGRCIVVPNDRF
jgi:hypothetical protein